MKRNGTTLKMGFGHSPLGEKKEKNKYAPKMDDLVKKWRAERQKKYGVHSMQEVQSNEE